MSDDIARLRRPLMRPGATQTRPPLRLHGCRVYAGGGGLSNGVGTGLCPRRSTLDAGR